jgi:hypothetical protein
MKNTNFAHPVMDEIASVSSGRITWNLILTRILVVFMQPYSTGFRAAFFAKVKFLASHWGEVLRVCGLEVI